MTICEMQEKILHLKEKNDFCILAHSYQNREILEVADFTGDSYALAKKAQNVSQKNILMCGVRFMADTVKILSPKKRVYLSCSDAGCPMAEQMDVEMISEIKKQNPDYVVAAYINTTTELKTICDVCVTSSSAVKILSAMTENNIIFIPDINLGTYVKSQLPQKNFILLEGGCPVHAAVTAEDVLKAKKCHPDAKFLVHPECVKEVAALSDFVGSTSEIMEYAKNSKNKEFIIGTENSIVQHLQFECPDKEFYPVSKDLICHNMKATTLSDVYACCDMRGGEEIVLDEDIRLAAKKSIDKMIEYGG